MRALGLPGLIERNAVSIESPTDKMKTTSGNGPKVALPRGAGNDRARREAVPWRQLVAWSAWAFVAAACGSFGSSESSGLGRNGVVENVCTATSGQCYDDEYCDAPDCTSQGVCKPRPELKTGDPENWACGCDGVTYWSVTYANAVGMTAPTIGQCGGQCSCGAIKPAPPRSCSSSSHCPNGTHCGGPSSCNGEAGTAAKCWAWPPTAVCSSTALTGFKSCDGTGGCMTECQAVLKGKAYSMTSIGCQ